MRTKLQKLINKIRILLANKQEILDELHRIPEYYYLTTEDVERMLEENNDEKT